MNQKKLADPRPVRSSADVVDRFAAKTLAALADDTFVRLHLSHPIDGDGPRTITGRAVLLKGRLHLSLNSEFLRQEETQNLPIAQVEAWLRSRLGQVFRSAMLRTTRADWQLYLPESDPPRLVRHKPSVGEAPPRTHDQSRPSLLDPTAHDWLQQLGVLDGSGRVRASMADKHRQIHRYLEILNHLAADCGWTDRARPDSRELTLADMGCGKGYLTFAVWHLFNRILQRPTRVIGVETRTELVEQTAAVAARLQAERLEFRPGEIATTPLPPLDGLIALHACDTATDDAILCGLRQGARLIVVAPCCHQALRPQLGSPEALAAVLRHGLMRERFAEWVTDALRALYLEWAGYRVKMIEFVASEHTPKNLMIAAVRQAHPCHAPSARAAILQLKNFAGVARHPLDPCLNQ